MIKRRLALFSLLALGFAAPLLIVGALPRVFAQQGRVDASLYSGLRWRSIGPFRGGRVNGVSGVPGQPNTFYFGSVGGGVWKTTNAGRTWQPIFDSQPIASIGTVGVAASNPNVVYVGTGEADMRSQISFGNGMYKSTDAGKTWTHIGLDNTRQIGRVLVDPQNPDVVFVAALGHVYGANPDRGVYRTRDGGATWQKVLFKSDDMTRETPGVPPNLDAATAADIPPQSKWLGVIYTIAPSAVKAPLLWIGTDDGYIHVTQDDGKTWANVTPRELNAWSKVVMLEASHVDANEAYAAVDRHRLTDNEPYIYRTKDAGKTWQKITTGLPAGVYLQTVKEDPKRRGLLVAGTELGVFVSFNDGDAWQPLQLNLPPASMRDLAFHDSDLIVATHGRGLWVLDDISVLRQVSADAAFADAHLFKPADAIILPPGTDDGTPTQKDEPEAENPPNGAIVDYYLKTAAAGPVTLEILNASGATIRRYSSSDPVPAIDPNTLAVNAIWQRPQEPQSAAAGMHRFVWDLRPEAPQGGRGRGGRGGGGGGRGGLPPVAAGGFSVKLTVNGKSYSQPLTVKPDPRER